MADLEKLTLTLSADVRGFQDSMASAAASAQEQLSSIADTAADKMGAVGEAMGGVSGSAGLLGTALKALTIGGFVAWLADSINKLSQLEQTARRAGVSVQTLAGYQRAARLAGVDSSVIGADITNLQGKVADDVRNGGGDISKLFEANGMSLTDAAGKLRDVREIIADISRMVENAGSAADANKIIKMTGLSPEWLEMLRQGPGAIKDITTEAARLSPQLEAAAKEAEEFKRRWNEAWEYFASNGESSIMRLKGLIVGLYDYGQGVAQRRQAFDAERGTFNEKMQRRQFLSPAGKSELQEMLGIPQTQLDLSTVPRYPGGALHGAYGFGATLESGVGDSSAPLPPHRPPASELNTNPTTIPKDDKGTAKKTEFDREETQMERRIRTLGAEAEAIGKSTLEGAKAEAQFKLLEAAKQANVPVTEALRAKIDALSDSYAKAKTHLEEMQLANRQWIDLQNFAGSSMIDLFKGATSGAEGLKTALKKVADSLLDAVLQAEILGKGPLAGILGTGTTSNGVGGLIGMLFGSATPSGTPSVGAVPKLAGGGSLERNGIAIAGEAGPEIVSTPQGDRLVDGAQLIAGPATVTPLAEALAAHLGGATARAANDISDDPMQAMSRLLGAGAQANRASLPDPSGAVEDLLKRLPKYGDGGRIGANDLGIAGERGPELIKGPADVIPIARSGAGSGGNNVTVHQAFTVSGAFTSDDVQRTARSAALAASASVRKQILGELNMRPRRQ